MWALQLLTFTAPFNREQALCKLPMGHNKCSSTFNKNKLKIDRLNLYWPFKQVLTWIGRVNTVLFLFSNSPLSKLCAEGVHS